MRQNIRVMQVQKHLLIACLNWGLGHASRCIPIIKELQNRNVRISLASDGRAYRLLAKEFPRLQIYEMPAYDVHYKTANMFFNIGMQLPKIVRGIYLEHRFIQQLVKEKEIDIIISDNRYGCYTTQSINIFLTHQLNIKIPFQPFEKIVSLINAQFIKRFDACWIPDFEEEPNLAGSLSHGSNLHTTAFIGALSRMSHYARPLKYDAIAILSGPEPQRTYLEEEFIKQAQTLAFSFLLVKGKTDVEEHYITENIEVYSYLTTEALNDAVMESAIVISRSGYSTIMDLVNLQKKAILIPTPGQTEQEFLADRFEQEGIFYTQRQLQFNLSEALEKVQGYTGFTSSAFGKNSLAKTIDELLLDK